MNFNYFLAISVRLNFGGGKFRYFLGLVQCAKNEVKYSMKILEKKQLYTKLRYSISTINKYSILALPGKQAVRMWHCALAEYFKVSKEKAMVGVFLACMADVYPDVDVSKLDRFEVVIGEVVK